jgi:hypothetical protein
MRTGQECLPIRLDNVSRTFGSRQICIFGGGLMLAGVACQTAKNSGFDCHGSSTGFNKISIDPIVAKLNRRPIIRVDNGFCVGKYSGEQYDLGEITIGLPRAVRTMTDLHKGSLREVFYIRGFV